MGLTQEQLSLKSAVEDNDLTRAKHWLGRGANPNFFFGLGYTPLTEAIRHHNLKMVKLLVQKGADVNLARPGTDTPLDVAEDVAAVTNDYTIYSFLRAKKAEAQDTLEALRGKAIPARRPEKDIPQDEGTKTPPKQTFTKENLKDIFNPESWVGKLEDMKKKWDEVPPRLKKSLDFDAVIAEARRKTLKNKAGNFKPPFPPAR